MRYRHAFLLLSDNFIDTLKLLLYRVITTVIFGSLAYVILQLGLSSITSSPEVLHLRELVTTFFNALVSGNTDVLHDFQGQFSQAIADLLTMIAGHSASIIGCVVGLCVIYLISRFVNGLAVFTLGGVVNDRMSTSSHTRFGRSYFKNLGKSSLYQVIYVPVCFVYDAVMLLFCWAIFFITPHIVPWSGFLAVLIALSLTVLAIACFEALKMTLISSWMPRMIAGGESVGRAFRASLSNGKDFGHRYMGFLAAVYTIIVANAVAAVFTFGSALLLTVPASYIFLLCMQFVNYYRADGKRYYVCRNRIEGGETAA